MTWIRSPCVRWVVAKSEGWSGMVVFRLELPGDEPQIRDLLEASLPGFGEADLVEA